MRSLFLALCLPSFLLADATLYNYPTETEEQGWNDSAAIRGFPSAGARTKGDANVYLTADFLWWRPFEAGLDYAVSNVVQTAATTLASGTVGQPAMNWAPGFQVGLGLNLEQDFWDLYGNYTWFHSKGKSSLNVAINSHPEALALFPTDNPSPTSLTPIVSAQSSFALRYNNVSLDLVRPTFVSHYMSITPSLGVEGSWQDQLYQIYYTTPSGNVYYNKLFQKMTGIGTRVGIDSTFFLGCGFSLQGGFHYTAMWSRFRCTDLVETGETPFNMERPLFSGESLNTATTFRRVMPVFTHTLGFQWERWFGCEEFHLRLFAGWEDRIYGALNALPEPYTRNGLGDFALGGFRFEIRLGF